MSYNNFIPTVWSELIQRERERQVVAAKLCYREFEGEIKKAGDTVKIQGVTRPTIGTYTKDTTSITPENLADASTILTVDKADYFAFEIDDIDKAQGKGNIMQAQMSEASAALAEAMDTNIYSKYASAGTTVSAASLTSATVFSHITTALKTLWGYNVPKTEEVYLEVSPSFMEKMILSMVALGTPNTKVAENGAVQGFDFLGCKVFLANGVYNDGTYDYCFLRTKKAIALADQFSKIEPYRPEASFSDAVKGLHLYGAKVIRPKELVVIKASYAAETTV